MVTLGQPVMVKKSSNIFLVGPMGVGKTTVGRLLARELGLEFIDSDHEIEEKAGADISWIFDVEGEAGFREREHQVLDELTRQENVLISTGGGAVLREENRRMLTARGIVVHLDTSIELQLKRTEKDRKRPLLQQGNRVEILERLRAERQPLYEAVADIDVFVGEGSSKRLVNGIVKKLQTVGFEKV